MEAAKVSDPERAADLLVERFGTLGAVLSAGPSLIGEVIPGAEASQAFDLLGRIVQHVLRADVVNGPVFSTSATLKRYLLSSIGRRREEHFTVLFLNASNRLLNDEIMGVGSVRGAAIYPRNIIRRALELGATALIVAHNHPSGDPTPSKADVHATRTLREAARVFDIVLHDHFIVTGSGCVSMREEGLL